MHTAEIFARQRAAFAAAPYPSAPERRANLKQLLSAILARQDELAAAIDRDFGGRSRGEVLFSEIYVAVSPIRHARRHLRGWMDPAPPPGGVPPPPPRCPALPAP